MGDGTRDGGPLRRHESVHHTHDGRWTRGRAGRAVALLAGITLATGAVGWAAGGIIGPKAPGASGPAGGGPGSSGDGGPTVEEPTPQPPIGGTQLYGFLPYWEMNATMAAYLKGVPVSTLALFSVTPNGSGALKHDTGYKRITGSIGRELIADAKGRHQAVDLVFTSFGYAANDQLFGANPAARARLETAASALAGIALQLGVDGVVIDVEQIQAADLAGYVAFLEDLRLSLENPGPGSTARPIGTIAVATTADHEGATAALAAVGAGADRVFLMGYNYHWSGSSAGATSPIHSMDTNHDLTTSIVDYVQTGVPRGRILLGLPLYGMSWPVAGPDLGDPVIGTGTTFVPSQHVKQLTAAGFAPMSDDEETAEWFVTETALPPPSPGPSTITSSGPVPTLAGVQAPSASPAPSASTTRFVVTFYDSPRTLLPKLELARSQGLAGAGFWAIGYERGLPGYDQLMGDFVAGKVGTGP